MSKPKSYLQKEVADAFPDTIQGWFAESENDINIDEANFRHKFGGAYRNSIQFLKSLANTATKIEDVKAKNRADKTQTKEAARVNTAKFANEKLQKMKERAENVNRPSGTAEYIREQIKGHKKTVAQKPFARETRDRLSNMKPEDAHKVIHKAISEGNDDIALAALGAPYGFHSNIDEEQFTALNEAYDSINHKADIAAAETLEHIDQLIDSSYSDFKSYVYSQSDGLENTIKNAVAAQNAMNQ